MSLHEPYLSPDDPNYDPLLDLLDVLDLAPVDEAPAEHAGPVVPSAPGSLGAPIVEFVGRSQPQPHGRVFGGQVLAQSLVAAGRTVADVEGPPRYIHSLHGYFLRAGDATAPIRFAVENLRDGRSFSARRVHALQYGHPILSMIFSFQTLDRGLEHQDEMPPAPRPQSLPTLIEELGDDTSGMAKNWVARRAVDIRHAEGALYAHPGPTEAARQSVWMRAAGDLPTDPLIHSAVLAYASDYTILEAGLRRHGLAWSDPRLRGASLDHSMWFHRPARADDWVLYTQSSPSASGGRSLGLGRMFASDGTHLATVGQEGMLRLRE